MNRKICCVIVTYNCEEIIENTIVSLTGHVEELIIVDNSIKEESVKLINKLKIKYNFLLISNEQNLGIAKALNMGIDLAISRGYHWVLTSDQDSLYNTKIFKAYNYALRQVDNIKDSDVGIFSPNIDYKSELQQLNSENYILNEKDTVITSGSLINTVAYNRIGKFSEILFIDSVDFDFCLKLRNENYTIIQIDNVYLEHFLGQRKQIFGKFQISEHNPIRKYYMYRNHVILTRKFYKTNFYWILKKNVFMILDFFQILLFESKKPRKLISVFRGLKDGILKTDVE